MLFLTGASGYVGMRIGERLAGRSQLIRCLVLPGDPVDPAARFPAEVVRGDVCDLESFGAHGEGVDAIVHAAAASLPASTERIRDVNVRGTANVVEFARRSRIRRLVFLSSATSAAAAGDAYSSSKLEAEDLVRESGLDYTVLKVAMVYGPGGARRFRDLVSRLRRIPLVYPIAGAGMARLRPVYVGDVVRAVELVLANAAATGKTYTVSGGTVVGVGELVDRIAAAAGLRRHLVHLPAPLCRAIARTLSLVVPASLFTAEALLGPTEDADLDHTRFREECGYAPLTLDEGFTRVFGGGAAVR